jgi:hypothetical protein
VAHRGNSGWLLARHKRTLACLIRDGLIVETTEQPAFTQDSSFVGRYYKPTRLGRHACR